jgi:hypothetical protein
MRWSVVLESDGDRVLTREEIVELADAVAPHEGVASGIGSTRYGARLVVEADDRDHAVSAATEAFEAAVTTAGLPLWPVVVRSAVSDQDDLETPG